MQKLFFTKHLAIMLKSGIPLAEALKAIAEQTKQSGLKKIVAELSRNVHAGNSLTAALKKHRQFDSFYISLVEIGEASGKLTQNLEYLADHLAQEHALARQIRSALLYPAVVLTATVLVGGFIAFGLLPQLIDFFQSFDIELPLLTRIFLGVAIFIQNFGLYLSLSFAVLLITLIVLVRATPLAFVWDRFVLRLPLISPILVSINLIRITRNLSTLLTAGLPITQALSTTTAVLPNSYFKKLLRSVRDRVEAGQKLAVSFEKEADLFPATATRMIDVGEQSGNLADSLSYVSEFHQDELDALTRDLTTVIEPVLLVTIGLLVGFLALAIITPIYQLTGSIGR